MLPIESPFVKCILKTRRGKDSHMGTFHKAANKPLIPPHKYCSSIQDPSPCLSANNAIDLPDEAQANLTVADALQVPKVWSSLDIHRANHGLEDRKPTEGGRLPKLVLGFQKMAADSNQKWTHVAQECQENMFLMAANCSVRSLVPKGPPTLPFPHLGTTEAQISTSNIQHRLSTAKSKQHHNSTLNLKNI